MCARIPKNLGADFVLKKLIFSDFGIEIFLSEGSYSIRYDAGGVASDFREVEVTEAEAVRAMRSEKEAYEVLVGRS